MDFVSEGEDPDKEEALTMNARAIGANMEKALGPAAFRILNVSMLELFIGKFLEECKADPESPDLWSGSKEESINSLRSHSLRRYSR
ncbi:MAG: hypothetical protein HS115_16215 [Spirochaetales bacterium]|nr:hypothetical protein [Spirochaetales bacterium]